MKRDLATVRQAVQKKARLVKLPEPMVTSDAQERSDLSAVRRIVQRKTHLEKPANPMLKLAVPPKPTPVEQITQPKARPVESPKPTTVPDDAEPAAREKTKPSIQEPAFQKDNVDDRTEDQPSQQCVEELSIVDMLRSAVKQISAIKHNSEK